MKIEKNRLVKQKLTLILALLFCLVTSQPATADDDARKVFEKAYNQVFGPEGCSLRYDVNLIGVYKTAGSICYKGEKNRFSDAKVDSWCDGKTIYSVYRKKKVVEVIDAKSPKATKYTSKFKFTFDDFDYTKEQKGDKLVLKLKQKKHAKGTVKEAIVVLDAATLAPVSARVKVVLFWANIKISNFKAGGINDDIFVFPKKKYGKEYKYISK